MRTWLMRLIGLLGIFSLVWLTVIIYWQGTTHVPSEDELVLYMGLVPLTMAAVVFGAYKLFTRPAKVPTTVASSTLDDAVAQDQPDESERAWTLFVVASALHTSAGRSSSEVLSALQAGDVQLKLDPELKNSEGFPVFAARMADLDVSDTQEAFALWQKSSAHPDVQWTESQYRALHLATLSANEVFSQVVEHPQAVLFAAAQAEGRTPNEDTLAVLRLIGHWPIQWSDAHQTLASAWLKWLVTQKGWPAHRIVVDQRTSQQFNPIAVLDAICVDAHRQALPMIGVLVACDSGIEQAYVDGLASRNQLFSGKNMQGSYPGEVAAALLFADPTQSQLMAQGPVSSLHRASWASRDKSADERGRVSAALLGQLLGLALETSKLDASKIQLVSADNDHNPSREAELAEMLMANLPDLDVSKDAVKVAQACGSMHQVSTTAALCLAHQYVVNEQQAAVCVSLHDPMWRAAVVLNVPVDLEKQEQMAQLGAV